MNKIALSMAILLMLQFKVYAQNEDSKLMIHPAHRFDFILSDKKSGANKSMAVWRPKLEKGYFRLGDIAVSRNDQDRPPKTAFLVKENRANELLKPPISYELVWRDHGSGGKYDVSFFRPIPPAGYVCLGDVAIPNYHEVPSTDLIRCVRKDLVIKGQYDFIWNDAKSGADQDGSTWMPGLGNQTSGLRVNAMVTNRGHGQPAPPPYLLKRESILGLPKKVTTRDQYSPDWKKAAYHHAINVFLHPEEIFFPSDVETHLENTREENSFLKADLKYDLDTSLDFLHGKDPTKESVPMYVIVTPKVDPNILDLFYFNFYPYNQGKYVDPILWKKTWYGNHVGDIEHATIRFYQGEPQILFLSQHAWGEKFEWGHFDVEWELSKFSDDSGREIIGMHPVLYSSKGAHGLYSFQGRHVYKKIKILFAKILELADEMGAGKKWVGRDKLVVIPYEIKGPGHYKDDLEWMNYIGRWGNPEQSCIKRIGVCRLENGPSAIVVRKYIKPDYLELD